MAETTQEGQPTPAGSEGDRSASGDAGGGASGDGAGNGGGSQAAADTFAAERALLEEKQRGLQAERDRLKRELDSARTAAEAAPSESSGMSPEQVRQEIIRAQFIAGEAVRLGAAEEFKYADKSILSDPSGFDSPEALRAAVEASHNERKAFLDSVGAVPKTELEETVAAYKQRYGDLPAPPDNGGAQPTGALTDEQMRSMSFAERDAYDEEHGEGSFRQLVNKHLRSEASGGAN